MKFHLVFDGFCLKNAYYDIFRAIEVEILDDFNAISSEFSTFSEAEKSVLTKLAKSDRKWFGVYKILPKNLASKSYANLIKNGILRVEISKETPKNRAKNERLKKSERRYKIENKLHFSCHFFRFWFRFIYPNLDALRAGKKDEILALIRAGFDEYVGLGFEMIFAEFLAKKFQINAEISSFWHKNIEFDIFVKSGDFLLVGEAKFRGKKVCKNVLNMLLKKCDRLKITPNFIAILSKSGFSNELLALKDERIKLYEINDLMELLDE